MRILIACEYSGEVRRRFHSLGHDVISCDLLPSDDDSPYHYQGDVRDLLMQDWDLIIAFPPCTDLAVSGAAWFERKRADGSQQRSIDFFMLFANHKCEKIVIENPVGIMSSIWKKPSQIIQPYQFGDEVSKKTCLWIKGLPNLEHTKLVGKGEMVTFDSGRTMPKWYADAWKLPSAQRSKLRSKTFPGIAQAMADQWGK